MTKKHYDGKRFYNLDPEMGDRKVGQLLRWFRTRKPAKWPRHVHVEQQQVPMERVTADAIHATFINHSTVLLQMDGLNILTDPIWSKRCGPFRLFGPKRKSPPGVAFDKLPKIDIVLVSHNHYDHMDLPTLKRLQKAHHPVFCVSLGNKRFLESKGLQHVIELDWWQNVVLHEKVNITFVPSQHFTRRGLFDNNTTLWGGFVVQGGNGPVYFAGDTGYGIHFKDLHKKFGPMCLSLLPIGAYSPRWFMSPVHMDPEEAVQAHLDLHSSQSIGIHFGTFKLSDEAMDDPIIELDAALKENNIPSSQFVALQNGQTLEIDL